MIKGLFKMGLPAGLQMTFEVGVFALATTLAGRLSPADLAAHQIVLNTASLTFMVPLGIGSAAAVAVGHSIGMKSHREAVEMGWKSLKMGAGFMAFSSLLFFGLGEHVVRFFTSDSAVAEIGKQIFLIAGFFQIADGIQTVGTGSLRGLGDTRSSMAINLVGHWLIGLPVGGVLCFYLKQGLAGLWIGLSLGLILVALAILVQWRRKSKALLEVDHWSLLRS
jgi:MATE family multidrug resistance protein